MCFAHAVIFRHITVVAFDSKKPDLAGVRNTHTHDPHIIAADLAARAGFSRTTAAEAILRPIPSRLNPCTDAQGGIGGGIAEDRSLDVGRLAIMIATQTMLRLGDGGSHAAGRLFSSDMRR